MHRPLPAVVVVALMLAAVLIGLSASPAFGDDAPGSRLDVFEARTNSVLCQVEAGKLSEEVGERAKSLSLSVRQQLIRIDADIEALRLEVGETAGERQAEATDKLVDASAKRARLLAHATSKMERLGAGESVATEAAVSAKPAASPPAPTDDSLPESASDDSGSALGDITIKIEPEDLQEPVYLE